MTLCGMNSTSSEMFDQFYPSSEALSLPEQPHSWFFSYVNFAQALSIIQLMTLDFKGTFSL